MLVRLLLSSSPANTGDEDGAGGEELLRRFTWAVARARVMEEVRRRRWHEDTHDRRKRKARAVGSARVALQGSISRYPLDNDKGSKKQMTE
ncbi:hypothetical protein ACP4OV_018582 [Aristida adscensionis]